MINTWWLELVTNEQWAYADNVFTPDEIKQIIETGQDPTLSDVGIAGTGNKEQLNPNVRISDIAWIRSGEQKNHWIFQRLAAAVNNMNKQFWNFDLTYIEALQFSKYEEPNGFYRPHIDMMYQGIGTRKLSFTLQLTDPEEYDGGDLVLLTGEEELMGRQFGRMTAFPSYLLHEVKPVTRGTRYSLVGWVHGPKFK